jgi:16S rRNA pseudouridine516 synthase
VTLARPLAGDEAERILAGTLVLAGETAPLAPGHLEPLSETTAWLTIREGRYHQVRRMFAALGNHVTALHRDRVGAFDLPADLPAGSYRVLEEAEREALFQS